MATTDIDTTNPNVPALPPLSDAFDRPTARDLISPTITLAQGQTDFLTQKDYRIEDESGAHKISSGDVLWHYDKTDISALIGGPDDVESFVGYVVAMEGTHAWFEDGKMEFTPSRREEYRVDPVTGAQQRSWPVWFAHIAVPELDDALAGKLMLSRTNLKASSQIHSIVARDPANRVDGSPVAVRFKTVEGVSKDGQHRYRRFACTAAPSDPDDLEVAKSIQQNVLALRAAARVENVAPQAAVDNADLPAL